MSRSNPVEASRHPCRRWLEWKGAIGKFVHFDKDKDENIEHELPFTFILLDRTATIRGYNKKQKSGIRSNEVRDTRTEPFVVKFFNDPQPIACGIWADIKDKVNGRSGKFAVNCYVAIKTKNGLHLACLQLSGCALGPWFEFEKEHRKEVVSPFEKMKKISEMYTKTITVKETEKGEINDSEFFSPIFETGVAISDKTNEAAIELDKELQAYFADYFKRNSMDKVYPQDHPAERPQPDAEDDGDQEATASRAKGKRSKGHEVPEETHGEVSEDDEPF